MLQKYFERFGHFEYAQPLPGDLHHRVFFYNLSCHFSLLQHQFIICPDVRQER
jgi:hypothetical protein